jgi:hypothetical protein
MSAAHETSVNLGNRPAKGALLIASSIALLTFGVSSSVIYPASLAAAQFEGGKKRAVNRSKVIADAAVRRAAAILKAHQLMTEGPKPDGSGR